MSLVQRTPPPVSESGLLQVQSEPDMVSAMRYEDEIETSNVSTRKKRPRLDGSPLDEYSRLKKDIQQMFKNWAAEQDLKFSKLITEISDLKQQNSVIQETNLEIRKFIAFASTEYDDMRKKIAKLEKERSEYTENLMKMERKILDLQVKSRTASIEFRNIPMQERETTDDVLSIVSSVCNALHIPIKHDEVRDVYRLPSKPGTNKTIVAEFVTVRGKNNILSAARNKKKPTEEKLNSESIGLSGKRIPIYISEYLPPSSKALFRKARMYAKDNKYQYCWTTNGQVFIRKLTGERSIRIDSDNFFLSKPTEMENAEPNREMSFQSDLEKFSQQN
ncbi:unnamed protein product [Parnassius apollo]|uniref:(apollo) hypothetical protein n=1 Tax=Parnassius apollo TaxID=110799 RepID=A0A8S3W8B7_PARAO|nr:unnamed protein product [Parnassius apollo]